MCTLTDRLLEEIQGAPEPVQREVLDFLLFLKARHAARDEGREDLWPLAASAWAADWATTTETDAWRDL